ncbi:MAG: L,D-transpeptidase family protein [Planctomycetes bacterium]|nr:L,D-transpeptidase family protein [Planctomycetota bacterium]
MKRLIIFLAFLIAVIGLLIFYRYGRSIWGPVVVKIKGKLKVEDVIQRIGTSVDSRLQAYFDKSGANYPPRKISFLAFKTEKQLELWSEQDGKWIYIKSYPILGASGKIGPKLQEGDWQVPEGIYGVVGLNPNSSYYLSIKINYPNDYDIQKAAQDGRQNLGGNIFMHGKTNSIGCLAMGDEAIEELFVLSYRVGYPNIKVIIAPYDLRIPQSMPQLSLSILWFPELCDNIKKELLYFKR